MTTFHGDLGRQPRGSAMEYHDRALKEIEHAFAGRAEQEVVAALEQAIRAAPAFSLIRPAFVSALAASRPRAKQSRIVEGESFRA